MPSGGVISKDEPTHEKLPSSDSGPVSRARVEGDGMDAHIEKDTGNKSASTEISKDTKIKDDKPEEDSNAKTV